MTIRHLKIFIWQKSGLIKLQFSCHRLKEFTFFWGERIFQKIEKPLVKIFELLSLVSIFFTWNCFENKRNIDSSKMKVMNKKIIYFLSLISIIFVIVILLHFIYLFLLIYVAKFNLIKNNAVKFSFWQYWMTTSRLVPIFIWEQQLTHFMQQFSCCKVCK